MGRSYGRFSWEPLDDLFEVQLARESMAAVKAARKVSALEITKLRSLIGTIFQPIRRLVDSGRDHASPAQNKRWTALEQSIHEVVFEASRRPWLATVAGSRICCRLHFRVSVDDRCGQRRRRNSGEFRYGCS